jgi:hypothetical protein
VHYLLYYNAMLIVRHVQVQAQINAPAVQARKKQSQVDHAYVTQQVTIST